MNIETREGLFAVMEQIAEEREAARPIVEKLVASGEPIDDIEIPEGWRTAGMVMELCDFAFSRLENDPLQSLAFAQLALAIAGNLGDDLYPSTLRAFVEGRAWKEVGYANRYLDAFDVAIRACKEAESSFSSDPALVYEEALARFVRSGVLFRAEKYVEAGALNSTTIDVFRAIGDLRRQTGCEVMDASIDLQRGHFDLARTKLEVSLKTLRVSDDLHTLGVVYNNLAHAYLGSGRLSDAVVSLEHAKEIFSGLDMPGEVNRADWGLALVLFENGEPKKALPLLRRLREDYARRHMPGSAGEIGLFIVDVLVASGDVEAAKALTAQVLKEFIDARLSTHAISALAYLRDLLQTTNDPRRAVRHVRTYVEKLKTEPARLFLPLDEKK